MFLAQPGHLDQQINMRHRELLHPFRQGVCVHQGRVVQQYQHQPFGHGQWPLAAAAVLTRGGGAIQTAGKVVTGVEIVITLRRHISPVRRWRLVIANITVIHGGALRGILRCRLWLCGLRFGRFQLDQRFLVQSCQLGQLFGEQGAINRAGGLVQIGQGQPGQPCAAIHGVQVQSFREMPEQVGGQGVGLVSHGAQGFRALGAYQGVGILTVRQEQETHLFAVIQSR